MILAGFAIYPALTQNIAASAHDAGTYHIYRGVAYSEALSSGILYPRWVQFLHLGLGSPLFTFLTPLSYAGMDLLFRIGLPHPIGWRLLIAVGLLAACAGAYLLVKELTGRRWAAVGAAVAFLYAPYVLRNAFERGSPEAFGTFLYPWVLWGLLRLAKHPTGGRFLFASGLWALCIASHVLAPLMLAPFAMLMAAFLGGRYRTALPLLALVAGGLLTAFIWMPMAVEQRWVHVERDFQPIYASPASNPLPLDRLLALPAVYDVIRDNNSTGDRIGLWQLLCLVFGAIAAAALWRRDRRDLALVAGITTIVGAVLFWMLTSASDPLWRAVDPILLHLQYRSRLMGIQALVVAILTGTCLAVLPGRWERRLGYALIALLILSALPALYVGLQHRYAVFEGEVSPEQVRSAEIATGGTAFASFGEFTPRWRTTPVDQAFTAKQAQSFDPNTQPLAAPPPGLKVRSARVGPASWDLTLQADRDQPVTLHLLYYPRWEASLDGQPVGLRPQPETGYVQFDVPAGVHEIALRYAATTAEKIGWAIGLLTLLGLLAVAVWRVPWRAARSLPGATQAPHEAAAGHSERIIQAQPDAPGHVSPPIVIASGSPDDVGQRETSSEAISVQTAPKQPAGNMVQVSASATPAPPWWLLIGLTAVLGLKAFYVDDQTTWLRCVSTPERVCGAQASVNVPFAEGPSLRGYSVPKSPLKPGEVARVNLYWQGEPGVATRLASFVHIRNSQKGWAMNPRTENEIWAQDEHEAPGGVPTTEYLSGRLYLDEFRLRLPDDMPPGEYFLEVGWADLAAGEQLEPQADAVKPPLGILWRSVLLPSVQVTAP